MMTKIELLEQKVYELYSAKDPNRADWADWLAEQHVPVVADNAVLLAKRFGANQEYSRAAALLHDIADAKMNRFDDAHEKSSLSIARELLQECSYAIEEIELIVDDAIKYHSCHDGNVPKSLEGKVLATADSLAHLTTNFYEIATGVMRTEKDEQEINEWVLKKLERDYQNKILFAEIKNEIQPDYERLKNQYGA